MYRKDDGAAFPNDVLTADQVQAMLDEIIDQAVAGRRTPPADDRLPDRPPAA